MKLGAFPALSEHIRSAFPLITRADADLFVEIAETVIYRAEDPILSEGECRQALFVIVSGTVRAQTSALAQALTHMGEGEVFGEISFVDNRGASLSIIADDDCGIAVVEGLKLSALLQSVPGLSSRFYHSLALALSQRVRRLTRQAAPSFSWG